MEKLTDTVHVLSQIIDELRDDFSWALDNADQFRCAHSANPLTSVPADPLAPDFGERINRFSADDLPAEGNDPDKLSPTEPPHQPDLF